MEWYDALLLAPKTKSETTIIKKPDYLSSKVRELKIRLLSVSLLEKKIAILISFIKQLPKEERKTVLELLRQSIYRDLLLSGLGFSIGFILLKGGISSDSKNKLFKLACITTGMSSMTFSANVIGDWLGLLSIIDKLEKEV